MEILGQLFDFVIFVFNIEMDFFGYVFTLGDVLVASCVFALVGVIIGRTINDWE